MKLWTKPEIAKAETPELEAALKDLRALAAVEGLPVAVKLHRDAKVKAVEAEIERRENPPAPPPPPVCPLCDSRNVAVMNSGDPATDWECHDCGEAFDPSRPTYRVELPATICFSIRAMSEKHALMLGAELANANEDGCDLDGAFWHTEWEADVNQALDARAYPTGDAGRVVNVEEPEDEDDDG